MLCAVAVPLFLSSFLSAPAWAAPAPAPAPAPLVLTDETIHVDQLPVVEILEDVGGELSLDEVRGPRRLTAVGLEPGKVRLSVRKSSEE